MTKPFDRTGSDPMRELQNELRQLRSMVEDALRSPFRIPVVGADPSTDDPTNIWAFPDGRIRVRWRNPTNTAWVTKEIVTTTAGSSTSATAVATPNPAPITRQLVATAQWSQSYMDDGTSRTDDGTVKLYHGNNGDANGRNRALIGFDYATIGTTLTGSTIYGVTLRLQNLETWYADGAETYFGIHNFTSEPATWAGGGIPLAFATSKTLRPNELVDVPLPLDFAVSIRDGWGKGIAVEAPNDSLNFYGAAAGVGTGYPAPVLIVDYAK